VVDAAHFRYWEKKPLVIKRKKKNYFKGLFSSRSLDAMLREHYVKFGTNIDLTKCVGAGVAGAR
jgi:ribosomal protein L16 Arg81 hydroxylase